MSRILVVDDEPDIRMLVRVTLGLDGHDVVEAGSGIEALEVVERDPPDLIVLDVMMPELSGWDTLNQLKHHADPHLREIPVLMLTALAGPMDRAKGGIEGAVRHLAKPIAPDDLRTSVLDALSGEPEPEQRRRARNQAMEELARMERGESGAAPSGSVGPRTRFGGLEAVRTDRAPATA
ncbi:MAG: response regulator, partial [Actinomycetota bacterium]|nr:response regulator [Actinomycetota bacterium]